MDVHASFYGSTGLINPLRSTASCSHVAQIPSATVPHVSQVGASSSGKSMRQGYLAKSVGKLWAIRPLLEW